MYKCIITRTDDGYNAAFNPHLNDTMRIAASHPFNLGVELKLIALENGRSVQNLRIMYEGLKSGETAQIKKGLGNL